MHAIMRPFGYRNESGFTLVELLVVMGIFAIIAGMTTVSLIRPQASAPATSTVDEIVADLRSQQIKAMMGDSGSGSTAQPHGMYVQSNQYTLFKGTTYSSSDADNIVITAKQGVTLSTNLSSSQVVFLKGTGEVNNYNASAATITVQSTITGQTAQIVLNRLGSMAIN